MGRFNEIFGRESLLVFLMAIIGFLLLSNILHSLCVVFLLAIVILILYVARWYGQNYGLQKILLVTLVTLYSVTVVTSVIAATKIIRFDVRGISQWLFSGEMTVPAGVIVYAVSFLITDLISEVYGKRYAVGAVYLGFISMLIFSLYSYIMVWWHPASYWEMQEPFTSVVGLSLRITFAGWFSFLISQHWDVAIFHWLKGKKESNNSNDKQRLPALWVRNTFSTITSQFIDSTLFISIAFLGIYDNPVVINMIVAQWMIKCIIALIDTPFAYWGRHILISDEKKD